MQSIPMSTRLCAPGTTLRRMAQSLVAPLHAAKGFGAPLVSKDLLVPKQTPTVTKLDFKLPLEIVKYPDPRLRAMNAKVAVFDESLLSLAREMIKVMYQDDGVGLAAPQIGVNVRLMVFNPLGREQPGNEFILVNPEIVSTSKTIEQGQEGCLSFPQIYADVERHRDIIIRAQNEMGEPVTLELGGSDEAAWKARIFQHEYDHLQGILFHDRMKKDQLETVREALVLMEEGFVAEHPGVKVQRVPVPKVFKGFGAK